MKAVCPKHERAYDVAESCPYCEPVKAEPVAGIADYHQRNLAGLTPHERSRMVDYWFTRGDITSDHATELLVGECAEGE